MTGGNQRQRLSMVNVIALGLLCLSLLPSTDSKPICPELLHVMELFLTGNKEDYINSVSNYTSDSKTIDVAETLKDCVDSSMKPQYKQATYNFVEYLSQDVCQKTL